MTATIACLLLSAATLPAWNFNADDTAPAWEPNAHHAETRLVDDLLRTRTIGEDPILMCRGLDFETTPWQLVVIRLRSDKAGSASLYWTGTNEPPYEGLSEAKRNGFNVLGGADWQDIAIYPGWQAEGRIEKLRLDFFGEANIDVDHIKIVDWSQGRAPVTTLEGNDLVRNTAWHRPAGPPLWLSPPLAVSAETQRFIAITLSSPIAGQGTVFWSTAHGVQRTYFDIEPAVSRVYNLEVESDPAWAGTVQAIGIELPNSFPAPQISVGLATAPQGPPRYVLDYVGFENGVNRVGAPASLLAHLRNIGGQATTESTVHWDTPGLAPSHAQHAFQAPAWGEPVELRHTVTADAEGTYPLAARVEMPQGPAVSAVASLHVFPARTPETAEYVPAPQPVPTSVDVLAYYFPGWPNSAAWDPIRGTAPGRKPLLGYYDETNPEVVDWQIKWSVENGISGYLVDWYWTGGAQHLTHWFDAYRKARYRDQLKVAIMWANHNPPGTHSAEDWRAATQVWIDHYFTLPAYYRIGGLPAIFLWDPRNLRNDLGGSEAVRDVLAASQAMARDAGYPGIAFVTLFGHAVQAETAQLEFEGYHGITSYHEWGNAPALGDSPLRMHYDDVVATAPVAWESERARAGKLVYYPTIDTGWDARPWHGAAAQVIHGRTVTGFTALLRSGRAYAKQHALPFVVLGPTNEWGEGSYIEPCTEFGFGMFEAVREVFATTPPAEWPPNLAPRDVDLGPYDLPVPPPQTLWRFANDTAGWSPMMNVARCRAEAGALCFETTSPDPAIRVALSRVRGEDYAALEFEMRITPGTVTALADSAQLFWSMSGRAMLESTSLHIPLHSDGAWHTYQFPLAAAPRWRGAITALRLDPTNRAGVAVEIRRMELVPAKTS